MACLISRIICDLCLVCCAACLQSCVCALSTSATFMLLDCHITSVACSCYLCSFHACLLHPMPDQSVPILPLWVPATCSCVKQLWTATVCLWLNRVTWTHSHFYYFSMQANYLFTCGGLTLLSKVDHFYDHQLSFNVCME